MQKKLNLYFFNLQGQYLLKKAKIRLSGKRLYSSNSIKYLGVRIDRLLHWYDQTNSFAVKLNRANVLLLKIRNCQYENIKKYLLCNI